MSKLDGYHIMVVSQYFIKVQDFITVESVCKSIGNMGKFHFNPLPLTLKTVKYFSNIETLYIWKKEDENFGNPIIKGLLTDVMSKIKHGFKYYKEFYQILVWYEVDYFTVNNNCNRNIIFKNVVFTERDKNIIGKNITRCVRPLVATVLIVAI
ncbi:hypothetical protein EIN_064860 [Entamoeba invadens IP1]|uniref:Uncharacterized protein n=1 Tax=Entamoeba invadens IP1 TaxID=370355 RepID=A0A0A1TVA7_ENTIV|nr:hypothetical protein EIN_064860 [Entamoeba invadens IP1]ELP84251.1 hypothetical protein EIN_064860 [Entamoeba invadens IP1]|eukprot:XP_004183597.1 hypothetical protein EIN_064860 [Entamoeba invadens IP1]